MKVVTQCPDCGKTFRIDATNLGRKGECARCHSVFELNQLDPALMGSDYSAPTPEPISHDEEIPQAETKSTGNYLPMERAAILCAVCFIVGTAVGTGGTTLYLSRQESSKVAEQVAKNPNPPVAQQPVAQAPLIAAPKPRKMPELFKTQVLNYIKAAGKLDSLTTQGVNITEFRDQLASVRAELDLLEQTWPQDLDRGAMKQFNDSIIAYDLTHRLWKGEIAKYDSPVEPNINGWQDYVECAGGNLIVDVYPDDFIVPQYRGKRFLPQNQNISVLMSIGAARFKQGRESVLPLLQ